MTNQKYETVLTQFANTEFVSIRIDGIDYYPVSQLPTDSTGNKGFPVRQEFIARDLERIWGKGFPTAKFLTSLNSRKVVCIDHTTLAKLVKLIARKKDSEYCWDLLEACFDTELKRANDSTRGVQQQEAYYQEWLSERSAGIKRRRNFTDFVSMCRETDIAINYGYLTLEIYRYTGILDKYRAWSKVYTTKSLKAKNPFRCSLNQLELYEIGCLEDMIANVGNKKELSPQQSMKWIKENI